MSVYHLESGWNMDKSPSARGSEGLIRLPSGWDHTERGFLDTFEAWRTYITMALDETRQFNDKMFEVMTMGSPAKALSCLRRGIGKSVLFVTETW